MPDEFGLTQRINKVNTDTFTEMTHSNPPFPMLLNDSFTIDDFMLSERRMSSHLENPMNDDASPTGGSNYFEQTKSNLMTKIDEVKVDSVGSNLSSAKKHQNSRYEKETIEEDEKWIVGLMLLKKKYIGMFENY